MHIMPNFETFYGETASEQPASEQLLTTQSEHSKELEKSLKYWIDAIILGVHSGNNYFDGPAVEQLLQQYLGSGYTDETIVKQARTVLSVYDKLETGRNQISSLPDYE
jgi:hypothetical protein